MDEHRHTSNGFVIYIHRLAAFVSPKVRYMNK